MPVKLPVECWLDTFRHLSKPTLGLRIALCSRHFNGIVNLRILGSEAERTIDKLLIFEERLWIDTNGTSCQVPVPECLPPWNVHFKSITVFGALGPCTAKLLRLLTSSTSTVNRHQQPSVVLQLDGSSRFAQHCGPRAWLNNANIRRLVLAKRSQQRFYHDDDGGGPSLFQIFTVQSLLLRLLEIPTLECHLSEPDYNRHLLNWLQSPLPFEHCGPSSSPHHFDCTRQQHQHRLLILKGEASNIEQFLRDARQHFSRAMEPLMGYHVEIETNEPLMTGWTDYNFMTGELLSLQPVGPKKKTTGSNFRHFYSLQCHQSAKCRHHHQSRRSAHIEEELLMMDGEGDGDGELMMTTGRRWPAGESREDCNEANVLTISFA